MNKGSRTLTHTNGFWETSWGRSRLRSGQCPHSASGGAAVYIVHNYWTVSSRLELPVSRGHLVVTIRARQTC